MDFIVTCECDCIGGPLMTVSGASLEAWQTVIANGGIRQITCAECGCQYDPKNNTTSIGQVDVSRPRIDSIGVITGPRAGGTSVTITGHSLSIGNLVVKFDGMAGTGVVVGDDDHATVTTPAAAIVRVKTRGGIIGTLAMNDVLTGDSSGVSGTFKGWAGAYLLLSDLTGSVTAGEWFKKDDINRVQIAASDVYGPCDVTVENENGQRTDGGSLIGAFTYT